MSARTAARDSAVALGPASTVAASPGIRWITMNTRNVEKKMTGIDCSRRRRMYLPISHTSPSRVIPSCSGYRPARRRPRIPATRRPNLRHARFYMVAEARSAQDLFQDARHALGGAGFAGAWPTTRTGPLLELAHRRQQELQLVRPGTPLDRFEARPLLE